MSLTKEELDRFIEISQIPDIPVEIKFNNAFSEPIDYEELVSLAKQGQPGLASSMDCGSIGNFTIDSSKIQHLSGGDKEMNIKEKSKIIVEKYKFYVGDYYTEKKHKEIEDFTKESKTNEIITRHINEIIEELKQEGINKNYNTDYLRTFIKFNLNKEDQKKVNEIEEKYENLCFEVKRKLDLVLESLELCEDRDQVMSLLYNAGLVNHFGLIIKHEEVKGYIEEE